ncbi:hypothetical protein F5888DRAFT_964582 [Russula emetica]|nr:hypothetical protein F5888DRAFT_964582 [Russula emetica]
MRRYDIVVSGILLILSIIDFALAAPVLAQEKRQALVDVINIPKDVITVLGKRGDEELGELGEEYFKTWGKPVESSGTHASSSSAPSGPDHGSTNVVQPPAPNPVSSTANPDPLMEPSSCSSSTSSMHGPLARRGNCFAKLAAWLGDDDEYGYGYQSLDQLEGFNGFNSHGSLYTVKPSGYSSDDGRPLAHVPQPNPIPIPAPSADLPVDFDWSYWMNADDPPPAGAHWYQVDPMNPPSTSGYAPGPPPTEPENEVVTPPSLDLGSPKEPEDEVVPGPPTSPELTDPELHLDDQPLSSDRQQVDLNAAIYAAKGKAKESRRISGTARDAGNAIQRELQPGSGGILP